ncbi:MAG: helix-turn-helix domain-containing protein [Firmicutes bacterium]|nr:helix-turn-helix domain-containing protein [Bacillota bacterium]
MNEIITHQFFGETDERTMLFMSGIATGYKLGCYNNIETGDLFNDLPDLVPLSQAATILGLGRTKMYDLLGRIPTIKIGKEHRVTKIHLAQFVTRELDYGLKARELKIRRLV